MRDSTVTNTCLSGYVLIAFLQLSTTHIHVQLNSPIVTKSLQHEKTSNETTLETTATQAYSGALI